MAFYGWEEHGKKNFRRIRQNLVALEAFTRIVRRPIMLMYSKGQKVKAQNIKLKKWGIQNPNIINQLGKVSFKIEIASSAN